MIITLGWHHGAGKSTLGEKLATHFEYKRYSTGDFMRSLAAERRVSLIELGREAESDSGILDAILDERQVKLWETEDNFIIDGRLAFHFIPHATKIFLTVSPEMAAHRIFADQTRQWVETHENIIDTIANIRTRRQSENDRYMKYYGLHIYDMWLYDIVIDTTDRSPEAVFEEVIHQIHALQK